MGFSADDVRQLREKTNADMMDCKNALKETDGDINKAIELLKLKGQHIAAKKSSREAKEGCIGTYLHSDSKLGVLVEVNCETDFVAKNEEFKAFAKDIAMQIAACNPEYISEENVPEELKQKHIEHIKSQDDLKSKPEEVVNKIIDGKLYKAYQEICLLNQSFIKDDKVTIREYLNSIVAKFGENIKISKFIRYKVGGK